MKVEIDGVEYVKKEDDPKVYSHGDRFKKGDDDEKYILVQVAANGVCLVCLEDGDRWTGLIKVKDSRKITEDEFKKICGDNTFTRYWDIEKGELTDA